LPVGRDGFIEIVDVVTMNDGARVLMWPGNGRWIVRDGVARAARTGCYFTHPSCGSKDADAYWVPFRDLEHGLDNWIGQLEDKPWCTPGILQAVHVAAEAIQR
jgi:hypothetical protein